VKLEAVRRDLEEKYPNVQIDVVVFDMGATMGEQPNSLTRIREACNEITDKRDVSLLFHFAGITEVMMIIHFLSFTFISIMRTTTMVMMMMVNDYIMTRWADILTCLLPSFVTSLRSNVFPILL